MAIELGEQPSHSFLLLSCSAFDDNLFTVNATQSLLLLKEEDVQS